MVMVISILTGREFDGLLGAWEDYYALMGWPFSFLRYYSRYLISFCYELKMTLAKDCFSTDY